MGNTIKRIVAETTQELFQGMYISAESPVISLKTIPNGTNKNTLYWQILEFDGGSLCCNRL